MTAMSFANNLSRSCCRRHSMRQLNRPSTQFSESYRHLSLLNDLNLLILLSVSISVGQSVNYCILITIK